MPESLDTPRLILAPWEAEDVALLGRMASNPRIMRYIGDGTCWSATRVAEVAGRQLERWHAHDFGWRTITARGSGEQIGLVALNYLGDGAAGFDPGEFEIGWWLTPEVWRQGFASEAAAAVRDEAFERLGAPSIIARLQAANLGSAGVARHIGMEFETEATGRFNEPIVIYRGLALSASSSQNSRC